MEIKIPEDVLRRTTECKTDFSCLSGMRDGSCVLSETKRVLSNALKQKTVLGKTRVCECLTRIEIYKRYKI